MKYSFLNSKIVAFSTLLGLLLVSCSSAVENLGGGCQVVAYPQAESFLKVTNNLSSGLQWNLSAYAFGADMKPGECTIFGLDAGSYSVEFNQCNIGDSKCTSAFGGTKTEMFSVASGNTYTYDIYLSFFQ